MQKDELLKLAERVEALSVGDRSLDAKIALAVLPEFAGWIEHPANNGNQYGELAPSRELFHEWLIHNGEPCLQAVASYTASLDAAMTLVPEGWTAIEMRSRNAMARWVVEISKLRGDNTEHLIQGHAATPTLALCAAALRALAGGE